MKFWKSYYCRWNPRMRPQDSVHLRHAQLLSLRDQLQSKVDSLTRKLDGKKVGEAGSEHGCLTDKTLTSPLWFMRSAWMR